MQILVEKEDLVAANESLKKLKMEIEGYIQAVNTLMKLNRRVTDQWEASQVEIERLKARLAEWEVRS